MGCISEPICDLVNELLHCDQWNFCEMKSPSQHLIPPPCCLPDNIPFKEALDLAVEIPVNDRGITDVYIGSLIPVCLDLEDNVEWAYAAAFQHTQHRQGSFFNQTNHQRQSSI